MSAAGSRVFFSSDYHIGSDATRRSYRRPFSTVSEHDLTIIANHNEAVGPDDTVYFLGDMVENCEDLPHVLGRLNGKFVWVMGNSDVPAETLLRNHPKVVSVSKILEIELNGNHTVLCHFPLRRWDRSEANAWHLFGHCHGILLPRGKSMDIGVDSRGFRPLAADDVVSAMLRRPDNEDLDRRKSLSDTVDLSKL